MGETHSWRQLRFRRFVNQFSICLTSMPVIFPSSIFSCVDGYGSTLCASNQLTSTLV